MLFVLICPKCGSSDLRRSRTRHLGEWLVAVFAAPYRCRLCDHRELVMRFAVPGVAESLEQEGLDRDPAAIEPNASGHASAVPSKPGEASPAEQQPPEAGDTPPHSPVA